MNPNLGFASELQRAATACGYTAEGLALRIGHDVDLTSRLWTGHFRSDEVDEELIDALAATLVPSGAPNPLEFRPALAARLFHAAGMSTAAVERRHRMPRGH